MNKTVASSKFPNPYNCIKNGGPGTILGRLAEQSLLVECPIKDCKFNSKSVTGSRSCYAWMYTESINSAEMDQKVSADIKNKFPINPEGFLVNRV